MLAAVITWVTDHNQREAANELVTDRTPITHPCIWSVRQLLRSGATVLIATAGKAGAGGALSRLSGSFGAKRRCWWRRPGPALRRWSATSSLRRGALAMRQQTCPTICTIL